VHLNLFTNFENMKKGKTPEIHFFNLGVSVTLKERKRLKEFILKIFQKESRSPGQLNYIFCNDKMLLDINKTYLKHDFYTDIITFDLSEKEGPVMGEIYISIDRVRDNAKMLNQSQKKELHRVIFHGTLHLCGYNDKKRLDIKKMREKEDFYLKSYGF